MITLKKYSPVYRDALMSFHLSKEDGQYTALPKDILDETLENPNKTSVIILKNLNPVGFFVLHQGNEISDFISPNETLLIRALSIDNQHHRQGIGFKTMMLVNQFVEENFSGIRQLALAVNMKNHKAIGMYIKAGYTEDHRRMGLKGEQLVLTKKIN